MRKTVFFAGFMGVLLAGTIAARADFATDSNTYPSFVATAQTIATGANAGTYAAGTQKDGFIKVATTKYVDARVDTANNKVVELNTTANTRNATVTQNETDITAMQSDRQVIPNSNVCSGNDIGPNQNYIACGYISASGAGTNTGTDYAWVKIAAEPCANNTTCVATN